mmetsp:Transcript_618/g.2016  ORF Transcript_618/g.2016 Transcript_618/m.2016 type:complete len:277 (-) Transcript_618:1515-2345(-)
MSTATMMSPSHQVPQSSRKTGARVREKTDMSLMRMLSAGPEVSLKGSPTVSPTTTALWVSDFLPPNTPSFSMYFLELSQAPPALDIMSASMKPEEMEPTRRPPRARAPMRRPTAMGQSTAMTPGRIISLTDEAVQRATQRMWSHLTPSRPSRRPSMVRNWCWTSTMMAPAALRTESMVRAPKRKGSMEPTMTPESTRGLVRGRSRLPPPAALTGTFSTKAAMRVRAVSTAEPMAKPLPVAAVVLPRASRRSVRSRTSSGTPGVISAMPPALSATGP